MEVSASPSTGLRQICGGLIWELERGRFRIGDHKTLDRVSLAMILDGLHAEKVRRLPGCRK